MTAKQSLCERCGEPMLNWHSRHYTGNGRFHESCSAGEGAPPQDVRDAVARRWFFFPMKVKANTLREVSGDE